MNQEIQDESRHLKALGDAMKRANERLDGIGLKDPKYILEMLFEEVAKVEYKTEVINHLKSKLDEKDRVIKNQAEIISKK